MFPANSCIPRCQRRAPGLRVVVVPLGAKRRGRLLHDIGLASAGCSRHESMRSSRRTFALGTDLWHPCRRPASLVMKPSPPSSQCRFHRHRVNSCDFPGTERLSPARSLPRALPTLRCRHRWVFSAPFRPRLPFFADLLPRTRSPWTPPAATSGAYLNLTPLSGYCNHTKGRAHWASVRTSPEAPFPALRRPEASKGSELSWAAKLIQRPKAPALPARLARVSLRAAATEANSNSSERPVVIGQTQTKAGYSRPVPPDQASTPTDRTNGDGRWRGQGRFPPLETQFGVPFRPGRRQAPPEGECLASAPFSRTPVAHLDG